MASINNTPTPLILILVLTALTLIVAGLLIWSGERECGYSVRVPGGIEIVP